MSSRISSNEQSGNYIEVFPARYRIDVTDRSFLAFGHDRHAHPPAALRRAVWESTIGKEIYAERIEAARVANELAELEFGAQAAAVESANEEISARNAKMLAKHATRMREYLSALDNYQHEHSKKRVQHQIELRRADIIEEVKSQRSAVRAMVDHIRVEAVRTSHPDLMLSAVFGGACLTFPFPIAVAVSFLAWPVYWWAMHSYRRQLAVLANSPPEATQVFKFYKFQPAAPKEHEYYVPVHPANEDEGTDDSLRRVRRETIDFSPISKGPIPIQDLGWVAFASAGSVPCLVLLYLYACSSELKKYTSDDQVDEWTDLVCERRVANLIAEFDATLSKDEVLATFAPSDSPPEEPQPPELLPLRVQPERRLKVQPLAPEPPAEFLELDEPSSGVTVLRGSVVHPVDAVRRLARHVVFANGFVQPFFSYCGVPTTFVEGQQSHIMCLGTSGSGKTAIMKSLMSALLPLTAQQTQTIADRSPIVAERTPATSHEWSRSLTFQAIVYNAKKAQLPLLCALGFRIGEDLIVLDPADSRCYAWDVAADVNDRDSIDRFAAMLVQVAKEMSESGGDKVFWEEQARRVVQAVIISLRNAAFAAGFEPKWNLRDLVNAVSSREMLGLVLRFHDTPQSVRAQFLDLSDAQASSIFLSATSYIERFKSVAQRWAEAERLGRTISFKKWMKNGAKTVLVLPNTENNPVVNEPLNRAMFNALTELTNRAEYSHYIDESGNRRVRKRLFFIDELPSAGRLPDLQALMTQGREFGAQVVTGVQQLSHLKAAYGEQAAETLLGLNAYMALLKTGDPTTSEWMSRRVGRSLSAYSKDAFTFGTVDGKSFAKQENWANARSLSAQRTQTVGTTETDGQSLGESSSTGSTRGPKGVVNRSTTIGSQTSQSHSTSHNAQSSEATTRQTTRSDGGGMTETGSHSSNRSTTQSTDLREEATVMPTQFQNLPDPAVALAVGVYAISPSYPTWHAELSFDELAPQMSNEEALTSVPPELPWEDDERVSRAKPWTKDDLRRLFLDLEPPEDHSATLAGAIEDESESPNSPLESNFDA